MRSRAALALAATLALALSGCALGGSDGESASSSKQVVVATHDSWAMSKQVMHEFTQQTGYTVKIQPQGDAGELTNKLVLTKDSPIADAVYGIDNTFATRALDHGVLADYSTKLPSGADRFRLPAGQGRDQLTPVDYGDVCVNIDDTWFRDHHQTPPKTLADLADPAYRDLTVAPGAATSSTGLSFLLATIDQYGDRWPQYWHRLMNDGLKLTDGWSDAYEVDFTGGGGHGDRPIVVSYASSPPYTIPQGGSRPTTSALLDTCFRQVEYAGVVAGGGNPQGARAFIRFMLRHDFQSALPEQMYVFPVADDAQVPDDWARWAKVAPHPHTVPPHTITAHREQWLRRWEDVTTG